MDKQLRPGKYGNPKVRSGVSYVRVPSKQHSNPALKALLITLFLLIGLAVVSAFVCARISGLPFDSWLPLGSGNPQSSAPVIAPVFPLETAAPTPAASATPLATPQILNNPSTPQNVQRSTQTPRATPTQVSTPRPPIMYYSLSGDSLAAVAIRFGVKPEQITPSIPISTEGLINPGTLLLIPAVLEETGASTPILPDSEIINSPSAVDFDTEAYIRKAGGYLNTYKEYLSNGWHTGAQVIERVATENSINPRLLLALIEYQSHWVTSKPTNLAEEEYPCGYVELERQGLYRQLMWASQKLSVGYYGWRNGSLTTLTFMDKSTLRLAPDLNAGSVAIAYYYSLIRDQSQWAETLYTPKGLPATYEKLFGKPWTRAQSVEPLFPSGTTQPQLVLPFRPNIIWSMTGGPHPVWGAEGPWAALDFAPGANEHGCAVTQEYVWAPATGLVVRSGNGIVVLDLDGDGFEQTGWSLLFLHIATQDRVPLGTWVDINQPIGHPSCEGGVSTGTHTHFARKYNGEWLLADGPLPFTLDGWIAHNGKQPYEGTLTRGNELVIASQVGSFEARITRTTPVP